MSPRAKETPVTLRNFNDRPLLFFLLFLVSYLCAETNQLEVGWIPLSDAEGRPSIRQIRRRRSRRPCDSSSFLFFFFFFFVVFLLLVVVVVVFFLVSAFVALLLFLFVVVVVVVVVVVRGFTIAIPRLVLAAALAGYLQNML